MQQLKAQQFVRPLADCRGQSAVEYIVVVFFAFAVLLSGPSIYDMFSHTMANKYHSYAFGVAISDPPRKAFDDKVKKDTDTILKIFDVFDEIKDLLESSIDKVIEEIKDFKMPSFDDIEKLFKKVTGKISNAEEKL